MGRQALMMQDVLPEIVLKAGHAVEDQGGGVEADGAVGAVHDVPGGGFDLIQGLHAGLAVQHFSEKRGQLAQSDPAGSTLPAGLSVAHVQETERDVDGTESGGACRNAALHPGVHGVDQFLSLAFCLDSQSAHSHSSLWLWMMCLPG